MSEPDRRAFGGEAEELAVQHLEQRGFRIRDRNVPCRVGELDIVAEHGETLVVVEVRMKSHDHSGEPSETVMYRKQRRIALATAWYLQREQLELPVRFDVVAVTGRGRAATVEHIEDAFEAPF